MLIDREGNEVRRLAYASFGEELENTGIGPAPRHTYTGKERDKTGLYYYGARYYDADLSRFIMPDTVYDAGPQGLNRYSYALNNPLRYTDPTGNFSLSSMFGNWEWPGADLVGRQMQAEAQGAAAGAIEGATSGALLYTTMAVPLTGEALDLAVLLNPESSTGQRIGAGISLAYSVLSLGFGPNYGTIDESVNSTRTSRISQLKTWYKRSRLASEQGHLYVGGNAAKTKVKDIALGLGDEIFAFAAKKNAASWLDWTGNLTRRSVDGRAFGRAFTNVLRNADNIHFNLNGIEDLRDAYLKGRGGFRYARNLDGELIVRNATNTEFTIILRNPEFLEKTTFYQGGKAVETQQILQKVFGQ